jgi:hypothetical protein
VGATALRCVCVWGGGGGAAEKSSNKELKLRRILIPEDDIGMRSKKIASLMSSILTTIFLDVKPCSKVNNYRRFGRIYSILRAEESNQQEANRAVILYFDAM